MMHSPDRCSSKAKQGVCLLLIAGAAGLCAAQGPVATMQLELPRLDGTSFVHLSDLPGGVVVMNFWRSDCPPCIDELPVLSRFHRLHPSVQLLGIATQDARSARHFLESREISYLQLLAPANADGLMRRFGSGTGALPYSVVLNAGHQICRTHTGAVDTSWLEQALRWCTER